MCKEKKVSELIDVLQHLPRYDTMYEADRVKLAEDLYHEDYRRQVPGSWTYYPFGDDGQSYQCSVCHEWSNHSYNYCPYCGARMKGDYL